MDTTVVHGYEYQHWAEHKLEDYGDFAEKVEFVNQRELGDGTYEGEWWYADPERLILYTGTFGNYNSPGASHHLSATLFEDRYEFEARVRIWESQDEYLDEEETEAERNGEADYDWEE